MIVLVPTLSRNTTRAIAKTANDTIVAWCCARHAVALPRGRCLEAQVKDFRRDRYAKYAKHALSPKRESCRKYENHVGGRYPASAEQRLGVSATGLR
jgi:hypothetical protein